MTESVDRAALEQQVLERATSDPQFRKDLIRDPGGTMEREFGLTVPERVLVQAVMDLDVTQHLGAAPYERTATRTGQRTGSREREGDTRVGTIEVTVSRVRDGSVFPTLLDPRKRVPRLLPGFSR